MPFGSGYSVKPRRIGRVYPSSDIEEAWFGRHSDSGCCRSVNMSFDGDAFYSYGTVIARRMTYRRKTAFVRDVETFSSTTSGHQAGVRATLDRHKAVQFLVHEGGRGQSLRFTPFELRDYYASLFEAKEEPEFGYKKIGDLTARYQVIRKSITLDGRFLHRVSKLEESIRVCEYFGIGRRDRLYDKLLSIATEIRAAEERVTAYRSALNQRRAARWAARAETARIALEEARTESVKRAESYWGTYRWAEVPDEVDLNFGNSDNLLDDRLDLKVGMLQLRARRDKRQAANALLEAWQEKWALEVKAKELDSLKASVSGDLLIPSAARIITLEN